MPDVLGIRIYENKVHLDHIIMDGGSSDRNLEKEFANSTSLHGIARVANNTKVVTKLTWLAIMLVCLGVCIFQVQDRFRHYFKYTANTAISVEYVGNLDFPAVTICNFNRYRKSQISEEEYKYVKYILSNDNDYDLDGYPSAEASLDYLQGENSTMNFNFTEFTRKAGFLSSALGACKWRGKQCSKENFTHVFTSLGNCWTFNSGKDAPILQAHQAGQGNGLYLVIDIEQNEYTETVDTNFEAGLKVLIHDQHTPPFMDSGLAIAPGVHAFVGVRRQQYLNLEEPYGKCDASRTLERFDKYTLEACSIECQIKKILDICNCRPIRFPGHEEECSPMQEKSCSNEVIVKLHTGEIEGCKCTVPCNHTYFRTSLSTAVIPNQQSAKAFFEKFFQSRSNSTHSNDTTTTLFKDLLSSSFEQMIRDNLIMLSVYYEELNFQLYQQTEAYSASALISDIGGQLGLFLGASFITIAEILSYLGHKVEMCFAAKKKSERTVAGEPNNTKIECVDTGAF